VCRAGTDVSADSLAAFLDLSPGALRTAVSRLRRIVGFDVLVTSPPGYELRSDEIDARRFEQLLEAARAATDPPTPRAAPEGAPAVWGGDAHAACALAKASVYGGFGCNVPLDWVRSDAMERWVLAHLS